MPTSPALPLPNPAASSTHDVTHDHLFLGARVTGRSGQCRSPTTSNTTHAHRPRATRRATTRAQHATHRPWTATAPNTGGGAALSGRPDWPVGGEVGVPCQPPPAPLNATTSPRWQPPGRCHAARRSPSRGRRRRDNDRPAPPGTGVQRGGFAVGTRGDLHKSPPGETRSGVCSYLHSPKRCVRHSPRPLTVVKWYRIYADWYKTDTPRPGGVVNKTQPKAPLPREGFGMKSVCRRVC